jgi:hypothetical protein
VVQTRMRVGLHFGMYKAYSFLSRLLHFDSLKQQRMPVGLHGN